MSARGRRQFEAFCKAFGDAARERGSANERRLLDAVFGLRAGATWILDARPATEDEDRAGADVVVTADVGTLYLQSKSSRGGAAKFSATARRIQVEAVVVSLDDATTRTRALVALSVMRAERMRPEPHHVVIDGTPKAARQAPIERMSREQRRALRRFGQGIFAVASCICKLRAACELGAPHHLLRWASRHKSKEVRVRFAEARRVINLVSESGAA
jgi:hypothetical protein